MLVVAAHDRLELAVLRLGVGVRAEAQQYVNAARVVVVGRVVQRRLVVAVLRVGNQRGRAEQMLQTTQVSRNCTGVHERVAVRVGRQAAQLVRTVLLQQRQPGGVVAARDAPLQAAGLVIFVITLTVFSAGSFLIATGRAAVAAAPPVARHSNRVRQLGGQQHCLATQLRALRRQPAPAASARSGSLSVADSPQSVTAEGAKAGEQRI